MIKKFEMYREQSELCNESLRDKLKGKSEDDVFSGMNKLPLDKQFEITIKYGLTSLMKKLIDAGVDPTMLWNRAINHAVIQGNLDMVKMLLKDDRVDPSSQNNASIKNASKKGYIDIVRLLLKDDRVDPIANNNYAVRNAYAGGHYDIVKILMKDERVINGLTREELMNYNQTILMMNESLRDKLKGKSEDEIKDLIDDSSASDLLLKSAKYNYYGGVKKALDRNRKGTFPSIGDSKFLHISTSQTYRDRINNSDKVEALKTSTINNFNDIVKLLLDDIVVMTDFNKDRLLRVSALNGNEELVEMFIDYGASPSNVIEEFELYDKDVDIREHQDKVKRAKEILKKYL